MSNRAAFYIDGFNLYHAIDDLEQPHLKWLDLWGLAERLTASAGDTVTRVVWCSAMITDDVQKMLRHRAYRKALESTGVIPVEGHFVHEEFECAHCKKPWNKRTEKEGDVNVAIHLISDGHLDLYDVAYLVTADSDQAATAKMFRAIFPGKRIVSVAPPGRSHSKHILSHSDGNISISQTDLEHSLFPKIISSAGVHVCDRPNRYDPPMGWKNPSARRTQLPPRKVAND